MSKSISCPDELVTTIEAAAKATGRSREAQAALWLETGKIVHELDRPEQARLQDALRGERPFDDLTEAERSVYLALLDRLTFHPNGIPGIQNRMQKEGTSYVVLGDDGQVVEVQPDGTERVITDVENYGRGETHNPH